MVKRHTPRPPAVGLGGGSGYYYAGGPSSDFMSDGAGISFNDLLGPLLGAGQGGVVIFEGDLFGPGGGLGDFGGFGGAEFFGDGGF